MKDGDKILLGVAVALGLLVVFFLFKPRPKDDWVDQIAGEAIRL